MKQSIITASLLLAGIAAHAQWYNDGASTNMGSTLSDWTTQATNTATGTYSTAGSTGSPSNYGIFEHCGQSGTGASAAMVNNGSYNATVNGRDYFLGPNGAAGQQEIAGSSMPAFAELFIQNGSASALNVTNSNGIRVATSVAFQNAITTTVRSNAATGAIKLDDNATYSNSALGDAQHVNGYVSKTGNDAFTYPVGSGTDLRTLQISAPATATDQYSVAWIVGDPTATGDPSNSNATHNRMAYTSPINSVSKAGQWDWVPVSGSGAGLTVTVSIPAVTEAPAATLRLVGWNGSSWVNLSAAPTASGNTEGSTLSGTMIAGIQAIGIGSTSTPLAVTFAGFSVQKQGCAALLEWSTASEHNNDHFAVERSADGRKFEQVATVAAAGNSSATQQYAYTDNSPLQGLNHYRIAQVDVDDKSTTTGVQSVRFDCGKGTVKVYPTVTEGSINVDLPQGYENAGISLYTAMGQLIQLQGTGKVNRSGTHTLQLSGLAQGQYLIRVVNGADVQTFKVIHQ